MGIKRSNLFDKNIFDNNIFAEKWLFQRRLVPMDIGLLEYTFTTEMVLLQFPLLRLLPSLAQENIKLDSLYMYPLREEMGFCKWQMCFALEIRNYGSPYTHLE